MLKRRVRVMQEHEEGRSQRAQQTEPDAVQSDMRVGVPLVFADPRLAHPANTAWRVQSTQILQRQTGNITVQRLWDRIGLGPGRPAIQYTLPPNTVARTLISDAERRARGRAPNWPELGSQQPAILSTLEAAARTRSAARQLQLRGQALRAIWGAIRGILPLRNRVTVQFTEDLGIVDGQQVARAGGASGVTLAYVRTTPQCSTLRGNLTAHQQHHRAENSEIHAIIQISPTVFHTAPAEGLANAHSILLHEYVHVEQMVGRGMHAGIRFVVGRGNSREFLNEEGLPQADRRRLEALDEIEAVCDEIQNAERTGLAGSFEMRRTIDYLWENYADYYHSVTDPARELDRGVVGRVWRYLNRGTRLLFQYLDSAEAQAWMSPRARSDARRHPTGYADAMIRPLLPP